MSDEPVPFSYAHQRGLRLKSESSVWRRGISVARRASLEDTPASSASPLHSSSSAKSLLVNHHSSIDNEPATIKSSSMPSKDLASTFASESSTHTCNIKLDLEEQINENLLLTQEIMDLKMRLATALAQVDAERHTNRLQSEQITTLCDDNEDLKNELDKAHLQIIDMAQIKADTSMASPLPSTDQQEGWLRRVSSSMGLAKSTSASTLPSSPRGRRSSSASMQLQKSMSLFKADLATEEVPDSEKSFHSSLPSFTEGGCSKSLTDQKNDDWLDLDTVVLDSDRLEHNIFTARRA